MDRSKKRIHIILNPTAAKGRARSMSVAIEQKLLSLGCSCTMEHTQEAMQAAVMAGTAVADGVDVIVAAGGDGTCNEVVNGMMQAAVSGAKLPELAIFPIGRGNDFAYIFSIPKTVDAFCRLLISGRARKIDVGKVTGGIYPEGRFFINGIGVGFEPMVTMKASEYRRISGVPSYVLALLHILSHYPKAVDMTLKIDGRELVIQSQQLSVCNGRRMGGAFLMGPDALADDGLLDLTYANHPLTGLQILALVGRFLKGTQKSHSAISAARITSLKILSPSGKLVCHADGETIAIDTDRLEVGMYAHAISLICPV
ncbi:MAG: YegS/Rv2252/BmrU family lipid kinase [Spirochaetia bacterium]|nr:YegS/Rv2252/BmrU family lipid kinase [Spirochaetia bacterium]MCF7940253.1 YegS/Rv2252/BmrU family lipid kinase [Spirochaetia bacterium]